MKSAIASKALLFIVFGATSAWSEDTAGDAEIREKAVELHRLSGLEKQSKATGLQMEQGIAQESSKLPADLQAVLQETVREQFADHAYDERAITIIVNAWNDAFANQAMAWLQSDLGRRITIMEEEASTAEGNAGLQAFATTMKENPPSEDRQLLIRRLNDSYGGTDFIVDFTTALGVAVGMGVNAVSPDYEQMDLEEMMQTLMGDREILYAQMDQFTVVYYLYTYQSLSDEEIQPYIDFLESEAGQWYVTTLLDASTQPLIDVGMEIGVAIREHVQEKRAKPRNEAL